MLEKFRHVEDAGREAGLDFRFAETPKAINTINLHRLLHAAQLEGNQYETKEALMRAYFLDRLDLTDPERIADVMETFGWSRERTLAFLNSDQYAEAVREEIAGFQRMGIRGVPFFIINQKYGLSGAQPAEVILSALEQVGEEMGVQGVKTGKTCDPDTGVC